jgi:hypothetical protein
MSYYDRRSWARRTRDDHWEFMERLARYGIVHVCPWAKHRSSSAGQNELIECPLTWCEFATWIQQHRSWFRWGAWDDRRQTVAYWLTPAGRAAARRKPARDDALPVHGGLVEPGWKARPRSFYRDLYWQRLDVFTRARGYRPSTVCRGELVPPRSEFVPQQIRKTRRRKAA